MVESVSLATVFQSLVIEAYCLLGFDVCLERPKMKACPRFPLLKLFFSTFELFEQVGSMVALLVTVFEVHSIPTNRASLLALGFLFE